MFGAPVGFDDVEDVETVLPGFDDREDSESILPGFDNVAEEDMLPGFDTPKNTQEFNNNNFNCT